MSIQSRATFRFSSQEIHKGMRITIQQLVRTGYASLASGFEIIHDQLSKPMWVSALDVIAN